MILIPIFTALLALPVIGLVFGIVTAVDVAKYPEWAFGQTGASKTVWQVLPIVLGFFCFGIGGIVMFFMWTSRREQVARVAQLGPPGYGYGAPPYPPPAPPPYPPPPSPPPQ